MDLWAYHDGKVIGMTYDEFQLAQNNGWRKATFAEVRADWTCEKREQVWADK